MAFKQRVGLLSALSALAFACSGQVGPGDTPPNPAGTGSTGAGATGGSGGGSSATGGTGSGTAGGTGGTTPAGGAAGSPTGGTGGATGGAGGTGGNAGSPQLSEGGTLLRVLTQAEYRASIQSLFGTVTTPYELPPDLSISGFVSVGQARITVNTADVYETAARAIAAEVFGDMARWQTLVGCMPQANLSDACVETFARSFGKRAFRRDLSDAEVTQWVTVAREAATLAGNAGQGLSSMVSGFLQSPHFLYRLEVNALDPASGRLKYDGRSMAVRLAYLLTGGPPSAELLAAAESGQLDTVEGVRAAAAPLLAGEAAVARLASFFYEYSQVDLAALVQKHPTMFPNVNDAMRNSMREGVRLFLERIVLAPGADVRTIYDSNQTFADAVLAPFYGVTPPSSGFQQFTLAPESGRVGLMGQAGMLFTHAKPDHSSPTVRGLYMSRSYFCDNPELPTDIEIPAFMPDPTLTTRESLELHRSEPACAGCHALFDPMGMAFEHFDAIGQYRATENGNPIDPSGILEDGTAFANAAELGTVLRGNARVLECLLRNFYRDINGRTDDVQDQASIDAMEASLAARNYVFRDLLADFVESDAFRSAPRLPITGESL